MDLVHELYPVQLLEVTKKSDNLSGWLTSIQHLAHISSSEHFLPGGDHSRGLLPSPWLWILRETLFEALFLTEDQNIVTDIWPIVGGVRDEDARGRVDTGEKNRQNISADGQKYGWKTVIRRIYWGDFILFSSVVRYRIGFGCYNGHGGKV